jgi:hypothetical protein
MKEITIDKFRYKIKPIKFDLSKLDENGQCEEYCGKAFIIMEDDGAIVRKISHFNDENNHRNPFDPMNYDKHSLALILSHGDESWELDKVYEIIWTNNILGVINTSYGVSETFADLIEKL